MPGGCIFNRNAQGVIIDALAGKILVKGSMTKTPDQADSSRRDAFKEVYSHPGFSLGCRQGCKTALLQPKIPGLGRVDLYQDIVSL